jgi:hypothetical protein
LGKKEKFHITKSFDPPFYDAAEDEILVAYPMPVRGRTT